MARPTLIDLARPPRQLPSDLAAAREEDLHRASEVEIAEVVKERRVFLHAFAVLLAA